MSKMAGLVLGVTVLVGGAARATADTIVLQDGTTISNCFARDEAIHYLVWEKMADVGTPKMRVLPRTQVKSWTPERDATWDEHPALPDLTVTFIEMNPKLAGLHWHVNYDPKTGAPVLGGGKALVDLGERAAMDPEGVVKNLKLKYNPGEEVTLTAHVRNVGFKDAQPFEYIWLIDGKEVGRGKQPAPVKELQDVTFEYKYKWQEGQHTATFKIVTTEPEIATINNEVTDALWGWGFTFVINKGRTWHATRSAYGTFCFEDYYRWHVELMNTLFAASIYPAAPEGIKARVRLDRIIYCDNPNDENMKLVTAPDSMGYLQGMWTWTDQPGEREKNWPAPPHERSTTEWSLPHELGHQLGLVDYYALDNEGDAEHVWQDNKAKVSHLMEHSIMMMHWQGPHLYGEVDAAYFNQGWDKPRGYFGDYSFAIPRENVLRFIDVNAEPVAGAKVEVFQRGIKFDPAGKPVVEQGVTYMPVLEDGDWGGLAPSKDPVIFGTTDADGKLRLPNRPATEVKTLNGFYRQPNPFGNINVAGNRGQFLIRITQGTRQEYYWLEVTEFNLAWFRGHKDSYTYTLKTPFGSIDSPVPPVEVVATRVDDKHVKVTWGPPPIKREMQYLDRTQGFRVYRRRSNMGLNDRPWFAVASLGPDAKEFIVDMTEWPHDTDFYTMSERFAVSALSDLSVESELVTTALPDK